MMFPMVIRGRPAKIAAPFSKISRVSSAIAFLGQPESLQRIWWGLLSYIRNSDLNGFNPQKRQQNWSDGVLSTFFTQVAGSSAGWWRCGTCEPWWRRGGQGADYQLTHSCRPLLPIVVMVSGSNKHWLKRPHLYRRYPPSIQMQGVPPLIIPRSRCGDVHCMGLKGESTGTHGFYLQTERCSANFRIIWFREICMSFIGMSYQLVRHASALLALLHQQAEMWSERANTIAIWHEKPMKWFGWVWMGLDIDMLLLSFMSVGKLPVAPWPPV